MSKKILAAMSAVAFSASFVVAVASSAAAAERGASFNEVLKVVMVNPKIDSADAGFFERARNSSMAADMEAYGTENDPRLPQFSGKLDVLKSIATDAMRKAALRTVESREDYHDYFQKLVHANGICFAGVWEITEASKYSGLFQRGRSALMIGRFSAASPQTTNDEARAFGFAGKLFPTGNPNEVVTTANFFTVDNLNGTMAPNVLDVAFVNEPPVDFGGVVGFSLKVLNDIFALADINPSVRPLYPIARAGLAGGARPITPKWMRIRVADGVKSPRVHEADFRDELSAQNYPDGLRFDIEVSDTTKDASTAAGWQRLGQIRTSATQTTFGCDRRLHFTHPTFKDPQGN